MLDHIIDLITRKNALQGKYLKRNISNLTSDEQDEFQQLLQFYQRLGYSLPDLAEDYLLFIRVLMEETIYFMKHGTYRYHTFQEVADDVYFDHSYMTKYMVGLALSTYLLNFHVKSMRWFTELLGTVRGKRYLEIGPGHGEYIGKAMACGNWEGYLAVDISQASIDLTQQFLQYRFPNACNYQLLCQDFFQFTSEDTYDAIVMGEVLEHVEHPGRFLEKIASLAHADTWIYVTTVINAPERDHIYLFHDFDEVKQLVERTGLQVQDFRLTTHNELGIEETMKKKEPIMVSMVLKRIGG